MTFLRAALIGLLLMSCAPQPVQTECAKHHDCRSCAAAYCGWCEGVGEPRIGCYSLREPRACGPATTYIPYCTADPTDPGTYGKTRRPQDGGASP